MSSLIDKRVLNERLATLEYKTLFHKSVEMMQGYKLLINGAWFIYIAIALTTSSLFTLLGANENISTFLSLPIVVPLNVGVLLLAVARVRGQEVEISSIFNYYIVVWPLFFAYIITIVATAIGLALFILPGIYLYVAFMFAQPLIADKKLPFHKALWLSLTTVTKRWSFFFGYYLLLMIVAFVVLAIFFALYSLISALGFEGVNILFFSFFALFASSVVLYTWLLPFYTISYAIMYEYLFDETIKSQEEETLPSIG